MISSNRMLNKLVPLPCEEKSPIDSTCPRLKQRLFRRVFLFQFICLGVLSSGCSAQAVIVDTDQDGLSDSAEMQVYSTDPRQADTDTDGIPDGQEIIDGTNPADPQDSKIRIFQARQQTLRQEGLLWFSLVLGLSLVTILLTLRMLFTKRNTQTTPAVPKGTPSPE